MYRITWAALAVLLVALISATAAPAGAKKDKQAEDAPTLCERAYGVRTAVVKKHGKRAPGRNVCRFGVQSRFNSEWEKPATVKQKARYVRALKSLNAPPPSSLLVRTAAPPKLPPGGTLSPSVGAPPGGTLASIAQCESGGNPGAVSPSGQYRGLLQFDYGTWRSVGGSGDPAAASAAEQYRRGAMLYAQRGAAPWPVCGR